jgi:hypothetical protein
LLEGEHLNGSSKILWLHTLTDSHRE